MITSHKTVEIHNIQ